MISLFISIAIAAVPKTSFQLPTNGEILRTARPDLRVEIEKNERESLRLATAKRGGRMVYLISYYVGEAPLRTQVFPESMYKKIRSSVPAKALQKQRGVCIADVVVRESGGQPLRECSERWPKKTRAEFAKWFKATQAKLFD